MNESEILDALSIKGYTLLGIRDDGIIRAIKVEDIKYPYKQFKVSGCDTCNNKRLIVRYAKPSICGECRDKRMTKLNLRRGEKIL